MKYSDYLIEVKRHFEEGGHVQFICVANDMACDASYSRPNVAIQDVRDALHYHKRLHKVILGLLRSECITLRRALYLHRKPNAYMPRKIKELEAVVEDRNIDFTKYSADIEFLMRRFRLKLLARLIANAKWAESEDFSFLQGIINLGGIND